MIKQELLEVIESGHADVMANARGCETLHSIGVRHFSASGKAQTGLGPRAQGRDRDLVTPVQSDPQQCRGDRLPRASLPLPRVHPLSELHCSC